jgi:glycine oxidase
VSDFLIVGGGIIGLLTARELSEAGADVALIDKSETGGESSWAGGGIISPLYPWRYPSQVTRLAGWSQRAYPALCETLHERSGIDPEYTGNGLLILDDSDREAAIAWARANDQRLQQVDAADIRRLEPQLGHIPAHGLWLPDVGQVRNPRLVKALRQSLSQSVRIHEGCEVLELLAKDGRVIGARTPEGRLEAKHVIVCAGAWTARLLEQLGERPQIEPVRGQMILFYAKPGEVQRIVLQQERYAIPRRDGRVLFGSTLERGGFDKSTSAEVREQLRERAMELFPDLRRAAVEKHWAGLRPGSPSGIPYIGAYPGIEGLYFNAGHFRNGVVLGPASARLMADLALGRDPILPPEPYGLHADRG